MTTQESTQSFPFGKIILFAIIGIIIFWICSSISFDGPINPNTPDESIDLAPDGVGSTTVPISGTVTAPISLPEVDFPVIIYAGFDEEHFNFMNVHEYGAVYPNNPDGHFNPSRAWDGDIDNSSLTKWTINLVIAMQDATTGSYTGRKCGGILVVKIITNKSLQKLKSVSPDPDGYVFFLRGIIENLIIIPIPDPNMDIMDLEQLIEESLAKNGFKL